jgi:hypothetical protein
MEHLATIFVLANYPDAVILYINLIEVMWSRDIAELGKKYPEVDRIGYGRIVFLECADLNKAIELCDAIPDMLCYSCVYLKGAVAHENINRGI